MCRVFVSYSSDAKDFALELYHRLSDAGLPCFFDKESLPAGRSYDDRLERAVRSCGVFVFVISHRSVGSSYASTELGLARRYGRPIVAVLAPEHLDAAIPAAIKSRTLLHVEGEAIAEVILEVRRLRPWRCRIHRRTLAVGAVSALAALGLALGAGAMLRARAQQGFEEGLELLRSDRPVEALPSLERAMLFRRLSFAGCDSRLLVALAYALEDNGRSDEAQPYYLEASECGDDPVAALNNRGVDFYLRGDDAQAEHILLEARGYLEGAPDAEGDPIREELTERRRLALHQNLAAVHLAEGKPKTALLELDAADALLVRRPELRTPGGLLAYLRGHMHALLALRAKDPAEREAHLRDASDLIRLFRQAAEGAAAKSPSERKMKNAALETLDRARAQ